MSVNDRDPKVLCDVCTLACELWTTTESADSSIADWRHAGDFSHQQAAYQAALRLGLTPTEWGEFLLTYRQPGETMLSLCDRAHRHALQL